MNALIKNFRNDESGAVTVDWVVLCAALVGLGIAVLSTVAGGMDTTTTAIDTVVTDSRLGTTDFSIGGGS